MIIDGDELKPAPWLNTDRQYKWKANKFQIRFEVHSQRINIIPGVWIDWEQGMASIGTAFLMFVVGLDIEYDSKYDADHHEVDYPER